MAAVAGPGTARAIAVRFRVRAAVAAETDVAVVRAAAGPGGQKAGGRRRRGFDGVQNKHPNSNPGPLAGVVVVDAAAADLALVLTRLAPDTDLQVAPGPQRL